MMRTISLHSGSHTEKRSELRKYFLETVDLEESLFSLLKNDEAYYQRPEPLRHPLVFYYGHTFTFYINKLFIARKISERINPEFESLFAVGVDEMSWDDLNESNYNWPSIDEIRSYREKVKLLVLNYISETPFEIPINWESPLWPILMAMEHHRIHLETSSVLVRQLSLKWIKNLSERDAIWAPCPQSGPAPQNRLLPVDGGLVQMGKNFEADSYGWDNEYGLFETHLHGFEASEFLVSNGEYLEFVNENGYKSNEYWETEGAQWRQFKRAEHPTFWILSSSGFLLRTLEREIPLPLDWPVVVNYLEAKAFCNWKSKKLGKALRLPSETEWYRLYKSEEIAHPWSWRKAPGNIHLDHFRSSCPVNKFQAKRFYDVIGNVWQWTETPISGFQGFRVHPLYDDFSTPTFDGKHNLIKGGSWISTGNEALPESRYAFRRHFFQHAGFRYVHSTNSAETFDNPYETDALLSQYCDFHYGKSLFQVANFPSKCIQESQKYFDLIPKRPNQEASKALDLGCATGRSTFELSRHFEKVVGLDFSARFINVAQKFLETGLLRYTRPIEGDLVEYCEKKLEDFPFYNSNLNLKSVEFSQADACNLPSKYSDFDFIFAGNLIDRLYSPRMFLKSIHKHIRDGGLLVLTSPYTWLEEYTPKKEWIGGFKKDGETFTTMMGLKETLSPHFKFVGTPTDIPFVIRETARKHQHTIAQMTVWQRRNNH